MQLSVRLSLPCDTFGIERMIGDKMICLGFFCYNIDTDLLFRTQNFNFEFGAFFYLFQKKKTVKI